MLRAMRWVFRGRDRGQDLAEYCLLTALVALIGAGIFLYASGGIQGIWSNAGSTLAAGAATTPANTATGAGDTTTNLPGGR